jgi:dihydropteroate synthase
MKSLLNNHPPIIMGILNVTPDSFSDGGEHNTPKLAVKRALKMLEHGANIIDIGGESTRPGAKSVSAQEQIDRIVPVIEGIRCASEKNVLISVDTTDYLVATLALEAGASWINDVSSGEDSRLFENGNEPMLALAARKKAPIILMHRQGKSATMQDAPNYKNVCLEVKEYLLARAKIALRAGVPKDNIILDPGIGFGKLLEHNLQLLACLDSFISLGHPVLLGTSRKKFIGEICQQDDPAKRVAGTCATTALGVNAGVQIFRVHDVEANRQAADVAWQIKRVRDSK